MDDGTGAAERTGAAEGARAAEGSDTAAATDAPAGPLTPDGVSSTARTCEDLADDPVFGGEATLIGEMSGGDALGCVVEVPADSPVLENLALTTTDCDSDGIALPFSRKDDGWRFDRDQLAGMNTGTCSVQAPGEGFEQADQGGGDGAGAEEDGHAAGCR